VNAKQERFVAEYLVSLNATQAAVAAGYSAKTAYSIGGRLLKHVEISTAIQQKRNVQLAKRNIDAEWLLDQLVEISDSEPRTIPRLKALELIGKHVKVGAFQRDAQPVGVVLILRDYTGRGPAPTEVDVTPVVSVVP